MEFISYFFYIFIVDCGTLSDPANGNVTTHPGHTFESTATYNCNDGYELDGQSTRTCLSTCHWSGSKPTCKLVGKFFTVDLLYGDRLRCTSNRTIVPTIVTQV